MKKNSGNHCTALMEKNMLKQFFLRDLIPVFASYEPLTYCLSRPGCNNRPKPVFLMGVSQVKALPKIIHKYNTYVHEKKYK